MSPCHHVTVSFQAKDMESRAKTQEAAESQEVRFHHGRKWWEHSPGTAGCRLLSLEISIAFLDFWIHKKHAIPLH